MRGYEEINYLDWVKMSSIQQEQSEEIETTQRMEERRETGQGRSDYPP